MFYSNEKLFIPKLLLNGEKELEQDTKFNSRAKFIPTPNGGLKLVEEMYCNRYIFNPNNVEVYNKEYDEKEAKWRSDLAEMYGDNKRIELTTLDVEKTKEEIKEKVNPAKWICVEASSVIVESKGNVIILIMLDDSKERFPLYSFVFLIAFLIML